MWISALLTRASTGIFAGQAMQIAQLATATGTTQEKQNTFAIANLATVVHCAMQRLTNVAPHPVKTTPSA